MIRSILESMAILSLGVITFNRIWGVSDMSCLSTGNKMFKNTGYWLIDRGLIDPGKKIKWEFISDEVERDVDTAYFLSKGIQEALDKKYGDNVDSYYAKDIHVDYQFSDVNFCEVKMSNTTSR